MSCTFLFLSSVSARQWDSQGAATAFQLARQKRAALAEASKPTLDQYLECAGTYRKVHEKDPHYSRTGDAIYEEGLVYEEAAERFSRPELYKKAIQKLRLFVKDYGGNSNCPNALIHIGLIHSKRLGDEAAAEEAFRALRVQYRYSADAIRQIRNVSTGAAAQPHISAPSEKQELSRPLIEPERPVGAPSMVQSIRFWSTDTYTRILIDLDSDARYVKEQLDSPPRVYFDIANAKISRDLNRDIKLTEGIVRQIRVAPNRSNVVRVVLDFAEAGNLSVSEMHDPFRIVVDLRRKGAPLPRTSVSATGANARPGIAHKADPPPLAITDLKEPPADVTPAKPAALKTESQPNKAQKLQSDIAASSAPDMKASSIPSSPAGEPALSKTGTDTERTSPGAAARSTASIKRDATPEIPAKTNTPAKSASYKLEADGRGAIQKEQPRFNLPPPKEAEPTSRGDRTLTRMLGLKVGRIVIDPGHGGHDQGSIGPGGLMEKDLVLSIAKSLRRMIEEKVGAEVFLTREDDTFVPLEERTAFANQHKADLFVSIHANSSRISSISGVETYYLDFAKTDAEREIAARENATSDNNLRDLEDLIKKIAQAEKSTESRELASILQKKLYAGARQVLSASHNRGVRSAPFIVLIGANMPSVLAEVSFISNPKDERLLKKDSIRQTLVKALFTGIDGYMKTLGSDVVHNQTGTYGK